MIIHSDELGFRFNMLNTGHFNESWLRDERICANSTVVSAADTSDLDEFTELSKAVDSDLAVYVDANVYTTSGKRRAAQAAAGTFIVAASVAAVALIVWGLSESDGGGCSGADMQVGVELAGDVVEASVRYAAARQRLMARCASAIKLAHTRDYNDFFTGSHLDLSVALVNRQGDLLWFRSGRLPLDMTNRSTPAARLTRFFGG